MIASEHWPKNLQEALATIAGFDDELPKVLLYVRVSSPMQVEENYSLDTQMESLRPESDRRYPDGCHLVCIADEGLSGKLFWRKDGMRNGQYRAGLTIVRELVSLGVVTAVGVYRCNRFARRLRIWLEFEEDFLAPNGVVFFSAEECIDTSDPASRMVFCVLMSGAEYELGQIACGVKDGLRKRRDEGYYVGCPSYGWVWQDEQDVPEGCRIDIEPIKEEAKVIRHINALYLGEVSPGKIAATLTAEGTPTATGGTVWTKRVVKQILRNPTNAGLIRDGNGELVEAAHYPKRIVEVETFYQVQAKLAARREAAQDPDRPTNLLFDGMLVCALCGATLQVSSPKDETPHYLCSGAKTRFPHAGYWLKVDLAEGRLEKAVLDSAAALSASARAAARLCQELDSHERDLRNEARRLRDRLARNESDICLWAGRSGDPEYDTDQVEDELAYLAGQREQLEKDIDRNQNESRLHRSRRAKCEAAVAVAREVTLAWNGASTDEKRELIAHLVRDLICEPTPTGVTVHVSFITGDAVDIRFYTRAKAAQDCGDLWALGPSLLTVAYYLRQGMNIREIAAARGITAGCVASQVSVLRRTTGQKDISAVVEALAEVLDARADELYLDDSRLRRPDSGHAAASEVTTRDDGAP